ncbi:MULTISPECIES: FAD-dependent monooxygenase [unclassified Mycobacterium]|uniref:FAD-dependent monooxygenase n=1 Tax=unclassified Mycobacterium TaxID=2642494 RepID=UPI0029C7256E|nr:MULTISPECIES: FAD-dependent monooxygenase [unclassified Mycobacterium]
MNPLTGPGPTGDIDVDAVDVCIVGGGPVGLAMAVDLGTRGVRVLLVDEGDGSVNYPTAESIDTRSMEWLRQLGISDALQRSGFPDDYPRDIAFVTRLAGDELVRFDRPTNGQRHLPTGGVSPEGPAWWPKFWFDTALRDRAAELPTVCVRYQWRCESVDVNSDDEVGVRLAQVGGSSRRVAAKYVVACDGARSGVRRQLGIPSEGSQAEAVWVGAFVEIPELLDRIDLAPAAQYYMLRPRRAIFGSLNGKDLWRVTYPLRDGEHHDDDEVIATIHASIGQDDVSVVLRDAREWAGHTVVSRSYRHGRVFLAGDAAHQMWPSGGHGMNTGIGDVHNLSWKLAAEIRGEAGPALLDSYEVERRPVALRNTRRAQHNYLADIALPTGADLELQDSAGRAARADAEALVTTTRKPEWSSLGVQLGYRYERSPVIVPDGTVEPVDEPTVYVPYCRPGHRAPHVMLPDGRSTLDLFGAGFVLLSTSGSEVPGVWAATFESVGARLNVVDVSTPEARVHYSADLVLVRPDGFVAWMGPANADDVHAVAARVLGWGVPNR